MVLYQSTLAKHKLETKMYQVYDKNEKCLDIYKICAILYVKLETKMYQVYDKDTKKHPHRSEGATFLYKLLNYLLEIAA